MQLLDISIRYNPVLEAVVTYTEDLAYKQAKEADDLLAQRKYLGIYIANQPELLKHYLLLAVLVPFPSGSFRIISCIHSFSLQLIFIGVLFEYILFQVHLKFVLI